VSTTIITGGNRDYFKQLKMFVTSLRERGRFTGTVVVCDNTISGTWDRPGSYLDVASFTSDQLRFFELEGVSIRPFHELLAANGVRREQVENIRGFTTRYPYKFFYCALLSKELLLEEESKVIYFDSDILFQRDIKELIDEIREERIYISHEHSSIDQSRYVSEWLRTTDLSFASDNLRFLGRLLSSPNYCSGLIGAFARTFNAFNLLCILLASNRFTQFHTDQPLVNVLISYFGYPIVEMDASRVIHLSHAPADKLLVENGIISIDGSVPVAVHFNGGRSALMEQAFTGQLSTRVLTRGGSSVVKRILDRLT
jgi:hypothetical protein